MNDLQPNWLELVDDSQQAALVELLRSVPRGRAEQAYQMLLAPGLRPSDQTDAKARAATVIQYLSGGYRVGDLHPSTELR